MRALGRIALAVLIGLGGSACTIRHVVAQDYPQYLKNNAGTSNLPATDGASAYVLTPETQGYRYEFRAALTGAANLWIVDVGQMLDDTLMSADVQKAFGGLRKVSEPASASGSLLLFELERYAFEEFAAHVALKVSLVRAGQTVFSRTYTESGQSQGGKMFWGGAFAQKNAIHQSTKLALDEILRRLIGDLNEQA